MTISYTDLLAIAEEVEDMRLNLLFDPDGVNEGLSNIGGFACQHFLMGLAQLETAYRSFRMAALSLKEQQENTK